MTHVVVLGSGFVGSAVTDALATRAEVAVYDLPTHPELAERGEAARRLLREAVISTGAVAVVNTSGRLRGTEAEMAAANVDWPSWLVDDVLVGLDVRFVHLGSAAEYGDPGSADPLPETATPRPSGIYGTSKWEGTRAVLAARERGLDAVVARGFNLVGPHLAPVSPLYQFVADVTALPAGGGEVEVWWPATIRDFILLDDLAEAVARLALPEVTVEVPDLVNLCAGAAVSFAEIVEALGVAQEKPVRIRSLDRPGIPAVVGDPTRLVELTGLRPEMSASLIAERART